MRQFLRSFSFLHRFNGLTWLLAAALFLVGATFSPKTFPDTTSYLDHAIVRAPGYPLLLDLARLAVGGHWPRAILLVQGAAAGWSARQITLALRLRFALLPGLALFLGLLLALPQLIWVPSLLTESLSHSLFLLLVAGVMHATVERPLHHFSLAACALALVIAIHPHFIFVGPVMLAPALVLGWQLRAGRLALQLAALTLIAVLAGNAAQILGNWLYNDLPARAAALGVHAAAVQLYLATPAELASLPDADDRAIAEPVGRFMARNRLFCDSQPGMTDTLEGFNTVFDDIIYSGLVPQARQRLGHQALSARDWLELDRATTRIAVHLARQHPRAFVQHVARQLFAGGAMLVLTLASALWGAWRTLWRRDNDGLLLGFVALLSLANHVELALVQVTRLRYVMSTDLVLVVVLLALAGRETRRTAPSPRPLV